MLGLFLTKIDTDLALGILVDFIEKMFEKNEFGRNCRVGFQLEEPMPVFLLAGSQPGFDFIDDAIDRR